MFKKTVANLMLFPVFRPWLNGLTAGHFMLWSSVDASTQLVDHHQNTFVCPHTRAQP